MRLRSMLVALATLAIVPLPARAATPIDCGDDAGREHLTVGSRQLTFDAPAITAPELAATHDANQDPDVTGDLVTPHRTATFVFIADTAPYEYGLVHAKLEWETLSDYDIYLVDETGDLRGGSDTSNIDDGQTTFEEFDGAVIFNCEPIVFLVRSWAGISQPLTLSIDVTGGESLLACGEDDPAPGCAGKAAGEAPEASPPETRQTLFFGGDPGQPTMPARNVETTSGEQIPLASTMGPDRPTGGIPNQHTRGPVGFRGAPPDGGSTFQNPFLSHFTLTLDEYYIATGDVSAMVWASAPVADATTTVWADLYADGTWVAEASVSGEATAAMRDPVRLFFTFSDVELFAAESITIQFATNPVATSNADVGNPNDAQLTVWYGSVQYQSRMTLPR